MKKKWIISAAAALMLGGLITVAVAQGGKGMWERRQPTARMAEHLDLTEEQQKQLRELRREHRGAMREQRETMASMRGEQLQAIMEILTDEQLEALKEMRSGHGGFFAERGRWGRGEGGHGRRGGGKSAFARLDLSGEQREQIKELRQEHRTEMRETRKKHRTALENVLTDEQREKLQEMKDDAFYRGGKRWRGKR